MGISVIVPAYNEQAYLERTLQSFKRQSLDHELIVVANGCTDDTASLADGLGARVLELHSPGISQARNAGANASSGRILVFNDADTIVAPNYLGEIAKALGQDAGYGAARARAEKLTPSSLLYATMLNVGSVILREACGNVFVDRAFFEQVGGYNEALEKGEDTALSVALREHGAKFAALWNTYTIPSSRDVSLQRIARDSWNYLMFLATGNLKE